MGWCTICILTFFSIQNRRTFLILRIFRSQLTMVPIFPNVPKRCLWISYHPQWVYRGILLICFTTGNKAYSKLMFFRVKTVEDVSVLRAAEFYSIMSSPWCPWCYLTLQSLCGCCVTLGSGFSGRCSDLDSPFSVFFIVFLTGKQLTVVHLSYDGIDKRQLS